MTDASGSTVSEIVAGRVREARTRAGLTTRTLAQRCADIGAPQLTASVLMNLESGRKDPEGRRRRAFTVDELIALAYALEVSPVALLLPEQDGDYAVTGTVTARARVVHEWFAGARPLPLPRPDSPDGLTAEDFDRAASEFTRMVRYAGAPDIFEELWSRETARAVAGEGPLADYIRRIKDLILDSIEDEIEERRGTRGKPEDQADSGR